MQDGTKRCATVQDAWSVVATQRSERDQLLVEKGALASEDVCNPTERSIGSFLCFKSCWRNNT